MTINDMIPKGWCFVSADMSMVNLTEYQEKFNLPRNGRVTIRRTGEDYEKFFTLSLADQDGYMLYCYGFGLTIEEAVLDAVKQVPKEENQNE